MSREEIIVVGGGFAGISAAAALAQQGARVQVLEASPAGPQQFRGELIHPRGVRGLRQLGLTSALLARGGVEVRGFAVTPSADRPAVELPYDELQGPGLGIDHHVLLAALRQEVGARRSVELRTGVRVVDFLRDGARVVGVRCADGTERRAELVVVADGRGSRLRGLLGMEPEATRLLSYSVAFGIQGELPCGRLGHVFLGAPGPILAYPIAEGQIRFCVDVPLESPRGKEAIVQLLLERYLPAVPAALREPMRASLSERPFQGCANHAIRTSACAAPGVVLLGDAGGCAHPLTASGMTNAMNDAQVLAELVAEHGPTDQALAEYQRRRYDFIRMRELFTDALYEVFRGHDTGSQALQEGVFSYWTGSGRARRASMDILAGEELRVSRFAVEYSRVFGTSAVEVVKRLPRAPKEGTARLQALSRTGVGRLTEAMTKTARKLVDRYRLELKELP